MAMPDAPANGAETGEDKVSGKTYTHEDVASTIRGVIVALGDKMLSDINKGAPYTDDADTVASRALLLAQVEQILSESDKVTATGNIAAGVQGRIEAEIIEPMARELRKAIS